MTPSPLSPASICARCWIRAPLWQPRTFARNVSRTSAINRGIRASQQSTSNRDGDRRSRPGNGRRDALSVVDDKRGLGFREERTPRREGDRRVSRFGHSRAQQHTVPKPENPAMRSRDSNSHANEASSTGEEVRGTKERKERKERDHIPMAIPYTTASSQFLYGVNPIVAALRANKRKLYKLHLKDAERTSDAREIRALAKDAGVPITYHRDTNLLDKISEGRPHNGAVLEASRLPSPPVAQMRKPDKDSGSVQLVLGSQNAEDADINGTSPTLTYDTSSWRHPFVLFLDGITDPGNLGGIVRTAHFYGVDAVAVAVNTCANLQSPIFAKASAGACEAVPILAVNKPSAFITDSGKAGWRICAAVAPDARSRSLNKQVTSGSLAVQSPLIRHPHILLLGSEGEGLRANLRSKADLEVTIERGTPSKSAIDVGVDSMNVGVAAGVLVDAFMRKPANTDAVHEASGSDRVF